MSSWLLSSISYQAAESASFISRLPPRIRQKKCGQREMPAQLFFLKKFKAYVPHSSVNLQLPSLHHDPPSQIVYFSIILNTSSGSFADDISFGKLIVIINTMQVMKVVQKAADPMDQKLRSSSPFLKLMRRRVIKSVNPALAQLKTMEAILFQAQQSKRDLMGLVVIVVASYTS